MANIVEAQYFAQYLVSTESHSHVVWSKQEDSLIMKAT